MDTLSYKTISLNSATVQKEWYVLDAQDQILGRFISRVAMVLRGKHKPSYTPHVDCGDNVIIINADKIRMTGNKMDKKTYASYSGYPGGQRLRTPKQILAKRPSELIEMAVKGMLPKNSLGRAVFKNVYVYAGSEHPHTAQKPKELNLNDIK